MTYRDDHEAALARVTALEDEIERWKADDLHRKADYELLKRDNERLQEANDELRAKLPKPSKKLPKPAKPPKQDKSESSPPGSIAKWAWIIGSTVVVGSMIAIPGIKTCRDSNAYKRELAEYETTKRRWLGLIELEKCIRENDEIVVSFAGFDAASSDPRKGFPRWVTFKELGCNHLDVLARIPRMAPMSAALLRWKRAGDEVQRAAAPLIAYRDHQDWKDDDYRAGPALWTPLLPALSEYQAAFEAVRRDIVPLARAEIRTMQQDYESKFGRSTQWWRIELGFVWSDLVAARSADETKRLAKALRTAIAGSPLELRRELRSLSEDAQEIETGAYRTLSDHELWAKTRDDGKGPIPERPSEPAGCEGD
jgi:hypothetical protein